MTFYLMFLYYFSSAKVAELPRLGKELLTRLTICSVCIFVISRFGFECGVWVLIAPVPSHSILITFSSSYTQRSDMETIQFVSMLL